MSAATPAAGVDGLPADAVALPHGHGRLARRARWLLLGLTLPLFVVVLVLAVVQYRAQREQVLRDLAAAGSGHAVALNAVAKLASDHVAQMKAWSEGYLTSPPSAPSNLRPYFSPRTLGGRADGYTLDTVPADKRDVIGQLLWFTGDPRRPETGRVLLDQALDFFGLVRLTHNVTPYFQWSYYFSASRDYVAIYPWAPSADVTAAGGEASLLASVSKWFDYEIYRPGRRRATRRARPTGPSRTSTRSGPVRWCRSAARSMSTSASPASSAPT